MSCVGHVHFILFVSISFAFGGQRKPSFQWNMGFSVAALVIILKIRIVIGIPN